MNILRLSFVWGLLAAAAVSLTSCGGADGGIGGTGSAMGTLRLSITDAPACGYDQVNVTIEKLRVHQVSGALDTDAGWSDIVLTPAKRIDLLRLRNGVLEDLGQIQLPAGKYTQLRLVLAANGHAAPWANSVVPSGSTETALDTPSAQQSGLKLNVDIDVPAGKLADFVLDFDACKSIVKAGNSGKYNLKPVVSVIPRLVDAGLRVAGFVDPSIAGSAAVSLQLGGVPVKATAPNSDGSFLLSLVPIGTYDLVVTATGRVTAVMTGVPVVSGTPTAVNSSALAISPAAAASAPRAVTGTVTPATATVRALQSFTAPGPTVEVAWGAVDAITGAFGFSLPVNAPVLTAYAPNPVALTFTADAAAAGQYTIEARSDAVVKGAPINANAVVPPIVFSFP